MVRRSVRLGGPDEASIAALADRFARIRSALSIPADFPAPVLAAAAATVAASDPPGVPESDPDADLRDLPFVTVDPPGSTDLDQAMYLSRRPAAAGGPDGYHVDYAIADVPAFVPPGEPVDAEARKRGQTLYAPDQRTPLHPPVLSENAASLLEGQDRPAFVWRFDLASDGQVERVDLVRALVRSRHRLDYATVQAAADAHPGGGDPLDDVAAQAVLLREIGVRRLALERARGGASLPLPEQEVTAQDGRYTVTLRPALASEDWNAQLSLMTGMAAATIMLQARAGILRTLPTPDAGAVERFRRQAAALRVDWPQGMSYGELLRGLRRDSGPELALMHEAGALFRGAGYTPLDPATGAPLPPITTHAAVAAPYAHVTAPLRRLVDRFGLLTCHALTSGRPVPEWVLAAIPALPAAMAGSDQLAGQLERKCTDVVEAAVLAHRVGDTFDAVVIDLNHSGAKVQVVEPAVLATAAGAARLGDAVRVRLVQADLDQAGTATVRFQIV